MFVKVLSSIAGATEGDGDWSGEASIVSISMVASLGWWMEVAPAAVSGETEEEES